MNKKADPKLDYQTLKTELDTIVARLQQEDTDVDEALQQYRRGLELVKELETYLKTAENQVQELKVQFSDGSV